MKLEGNMNYFVCLWLSNYDRLIWEHFRIWMINYIQFISYSSSFQTSPGAHSYTNWQAIQCIVHTAVCAV